MSGLPIGAPRSANDHFDCGDFDRDGCAVVPAVVDLSTIAALRELPEFAVAGRPGSRSLTLSPLVRDLVAAPDQDGRGRLTTLAMALLRRPARAVRVLYFDKRPETNWGVPWHQDRTIALQARHELAGYGPWSSKRGIVHVEPPAELLQGMVALRLHLDDCGAHNGPLIVLPGSWRLGPVASGRVKDLVAAGTPRPLLADAGDVVAMRGLTLHASERAAKPAHRRVLHVDFATSPLPSPLAWAIDLPTP